MQEHAEFRAKTPQDLDQIRASLKSNLVCGALNDSEVDALASAVQFFTFKKGDLVTQQGETGEASVFFRPALCLRRRPAKARDAAVSFACHRRKFLLRGSQRPLRSEATAHLSTQPGEKESQLFWTGADASAPGGARVSVQVDVGGKVVNHLEVGHAFGEIALIHNTARTASIRTESDSAALWGVQRHVFR